MALLAEGLLLIPIIWAAVKKRKIGSQVLQEWGRSPFVVPDPDERQEVLDEVDRRTPRLWRQLETVGMLAHFPALLVMELLRIVDLPIQVIAVVNWVAIFSAILILT